MRTRVEFISAHSPGQYAMFPAENAKIRIFTGQKNVTFLPEVGKSHFWRVFLLFFSFFLFCLPVYVFVYVSNCLSSHSSFSSRSFFSYFFSSFFLSKHWEYERMIKAERLKRFTISFFHLAKKLLSTDICKRRLDQKLPIRCGINE